MPEESFMPEERGTVLQPNKQEVSGLLPLLGKKEVWDEFLSYKKRNSIYPVRMPGTGQNSWKKNSTVPLPTASCHRIFLCPCRLN